LPLECEHQYAPFCVAFCLCTHSWDTQNQEFDKKMALETWQQAEQYLKDKAIKGMKQSSKYKEGILASTRYFTITRQF
jgi:hypothetical protein